MKKTKRSKRIVSMIIVLTMMIAMIVPMNVSAAGVEVKSHTFETEADIHDSLIGVNNFTKSFDSELGALKLVSTPDQGYYQLHFYDSNWAHISYDVNEEYTLSFRAKTDAENPVTQINPIEGTVQDLGKYSIGNVWSEYEVKFTPRKGDDVYMAIYLTDSSVAETIYFDYITVTKKAPALDVQSSTFENGKINPGTESLTLTFTNRLENPTADNFVLTGGTQSVTDVEEASDNSYVLILSEALDVNTLYSLAVNVNDIYGQNFNKSFSFAAPAKVVNEWRFEADSELGWLFTNIYDSTWSSTNMTEAIDTDGSMKIEANAGEWFALETRSGKYINDTDQTKVLLNKGQEYTLTFKMKAENVSAVRWVSSDEKAYVKTFTSISGDYAIYTATFTANGAADSTGTKVVMPFLRMWKADQTKTAVVNIDDIVLSTTPDKNSITVSTPEDGGVSDITKIINVTFSNEMNAESVANCENYALEGGTQKVKTVTKQEDGSYAIELDGVLTPNKEYTLTINASDIYAQKIENNTITFTTPAKIIAEFDYTKSTGWVVSTSNVTKSFDENEGALKLTPGASGAYENQVWFKYASWESLNVEKGKQYTLVFEGRTESGSTSIGTIIGNAVQNKTDKLTDEYSTVSATFVASQTGEPYIYITPGVTLYLKSVKLITAPEELSIISSTPASGEEIDATNNMIVCFNNAMNETSVTDKTKYTINDAEIKSIEKQPDGSYKVTFNDVLAPAKSYTLSINGVADIYGQSLTTSISFSTLTDNRLHYDMPAIYVDYETDAKRPAETLETGNLSVAVENIRNLTSEDAPIFVAIALYKDGDLVQVKVASETVKPGAELDRLWATISVPETRTDGKYTAKAFMWDNNLKPYEKEIELVDYALTVLAVSADGNGDFTSPFLANKSITDSSLTNRYVIEIQPGTYEGTMAPGTFVAPYTTWKGTDRESCIIKGKLDDSLGTTEAGRKRIDEESTINLKESANLENLTITGENLRYPVHNEGGGSNPDAVHKVKNCHIEHLGTKGATDAYFAAGGTDPYAVWQWTTAWGYGSASGVINVYDDTTFKSVQRAWYVHSNANFEKPQINVLNNCHLSAGNLQDITVEALGSTTDDKVVLNNCTFDGLYIQASDSPWIYSDMDNQYADHAEYEIILNNCEPLGYQTGARGKALAISSNDTTAMSSVTVGGTAADILFGDYTVKAGGGGLSGLIYGYYDISGILVGMSSSKAVNNTLGRRLGDCSGVNKTMTVTFDGTNSVEVIFSKDYTEMSNAAILSEINSAIGAYGNAFEYNVAKEEYYPQFTDKEFKAENTSDDAIKRFTAVCYDEDGGIRKMISGDSINDFAGIALENIVPGKTGRVLTEGYLNAAQMGVSSVANGNTFGINESGGFALSDTNAIFECTNNKGWAYFKANV